MIIARLVSSQQQASKQQAASVHRPPRPKTRLDTIHHHSPTHPLTHTHLAPLPPPRCLLLKKAPSAPEFATTRRVKGPRRCPLLHLFACKRDRAPRLYFFFHFWSNSESLPRWVVNWPQGEQGKRIPIIKQRRAPRPRHPCWWCRGLSLVSLAFFLYRRAGAGREVCPGSLFLHFSLIAPHHQPCLLASSPPISTPLSRFYTAPLPCLSVRHLPHH